MKMYFPVCNFQNVFDVVNNTNTINKSERRCPCPVIATHWSFAVRKNPLASLRPDKYIDPRSGPRVDGEHQSHHYLKAVCNQNSGDASGLPARLRVTWQVAVMFLFSRPVEDFGLA